MQTGKVLVAQGGGPTAVINESLAGVVLEARKFPQVERVYGSLHGVRGMIHENFLDLSQVTSHNLELVGGTAGSALGSTRDKPDDAYCDKILTTLKTHNIRWFFYIGGNDSSETLQIVLNKARKEEFDLTCIHIPKTIDNDLLHNDHTPGFPSAARFVAIAFSGVNLDNRALPGVYVGVVMGRHAGFLTGAAAMGRKYTDDGPHLIYLPERDFILDRFLADVKNVHDRLGRCVVAVSEGIHGPDGVPVIAQLQPNQEKDQHGNLQLSGTGALADLLTEAIRKNLGIKRVRGDTLGYLQRSFLSCVSDVDQREAREVGEKAAHFALLHNTSGTVTIHRTGNYSVDYHLDHLETVAGKTRSMPDDFIDPSGTDVTSTFLAYLTPLLGSNMPDPFRLRAPIVPRILNPQ